MRTLREMKGGDLPVLDESKVLKGPREWPMATRSNKLVRVRTGPHSFILMDEEEARKRGLLPDEPAAPEEKLVKQARNKLRLPRANKGEDKGE